VSKDFVSRDGAAKNERSQEIGGLIYVYVQTKKHNNSKTERRRIQNKDRTKTASQRSN
jgi:hypothetical protein